MKVAAAKQGRPLSLSGCGQDSQSPSALPTTPLCIRIWGGGRWRKEIEIAEASWVILLNVPTIENR